MQLMWKGSIGTQWTRFAGAIERNGEQGMKRTVSQCISSDYCKGWNDAIDELSKIVDDEVILALKAVVYGCNTNRRLVCGHFAHNINDPGKMQTIEFEKAIQISSLTIEKLISIFGGEQND